MLLGGVVATIGRYVDGGRTEQLPDATAELVQYLLIPYLEPEETRRIARALRPPAAMPRALAILFEVKPIGI